MEVSFLSSSSSFGGVAYNLSKVANNSGEILEVANFQGLDYLINPTIEDYIDYLKAWSDRSTRIKNSQFHVAISCKGHERTKVELLAAAKEWLKEMGYEGNPALFIFHHDTDNNHIHIITSRVNKSGKKVNDSNERWRGRAILKRIEGERLSLEEEVKKAISDAFSYRYENMKQFEMILESKGYKVEERDDFFQVMRYGKVLAVVKGDDIIAGISEKKKDKDSRVKQLKAILYKYKVKMSINELKELMRKSFGVELMFFGKLNSPYGYAIIDHKEKCVHKGGDIMPMKELLGERKKENIDHKERAETFVAIILESNKLSNKEVNSMLKKYGYSLRSGVLYHYSNELGQLSNEYAEQIRYNDRLAKTKQIHTDDPKLMQVLANHYKLKIEDLIDNPMRGEGGSVERTLQNLYDTAYRSGDLYYYLKMNKAFIIEQEGRKYMVSQELGSIAEIDTSNPDRTLLVTKGSMVERAETAFRGDEVGLMDILGYDSGEGVSSANNELKKKRRGR